MKFKCKKCKIEISLDVEEYKDSTLLVEEDNVDIVPQGFYIISNGSFFNLYQDDKCIYDTSGKVIINKNDMINWKPHNDKKRCNGCCGFDGTDGINIICKNGHEIGTLKSDCWMGHGFILEPDFTE